LALEKATGSSSEELWKRLPKRFAMDKCFGKGNWVHSAEVLWKRLTPWKKALGKATNKCMGMALEKAINSDFCTGLASPKWAGHDKLLTE